MNFIQITILRLKCISINFDAQKLCHFYIGLQGVRSGLTFALLCIYKSVAYSLAALCLYCYQFYLYAMYGIGYMLQLCDIITHNSEMMRSISNG